MTQHHVLVTGGSNGIGKAIIERLSGDGFHTLNLDIAEPKALSPNETYVKADLCDTQGLIELTREVCSKYTVLRLVNNAGTIQPNSLEDTTVESVRSVARLNLEAPLIITQAVLPAMKAARFGRIVNVSSRAALGKALRTAYAASKAGLLGMTRTWALELAEHGITVNAIGPGPIATELFKQGNPADSERTKQILRTVPLQRLGEPEDVAHGVASLLDDRAGYITGQTLYICGGMTVGLS
jgi:3-oxoacyl-[acyl-carrier protein] reductase